MTTSQFHEAYCIPTGTGIQNLRDSYSNGDYIVDVMKLISANL